MTPPRNDYTAGENLPAADVNGIVTYLLAAEALTRKQINAGETLAGATTPVPVYQHTDGELYKCDANDTARMKFIGFVTSDGDDGDPVTFQGSGIVIGFTGLTVGAEYFVSDTIGTISTTPGTQRISVGTAITTTAILIRKKPLMAWGNASDIDITASGTSNNDETITIGFKPKRIKLTFWIQGHTTTNSSNQYVQKLGEAIFEGTTLKLCRAFNDFSILTDDQATSTNRPAAGGINTSPTIGSGSGGSGAGAAITLSINSVSDTGFVLRKAVNNQSSSYVTRSRISWEAEE